MQTQEDPKDELLRLFEALPEEARELVLAYLRRLAHEYGVLTEKNNELSEKEIEILYTKYKNCAFDETEGFVDALSDSQQDALFLYIRLQEAMTGRGKSLEATTFLKQFKP